MARDRKRAKQRQRRRAGQAQQEPRASRVPGTRPPNDPLGQAAPDAELAELAAEEGLQEPGAPVGRPLDAEDYPHRDELEGADIIEEVEAEERGDQAGAEKQRERQAKRAAGRELPREGNRFINFLRACVAELRRVQWPDRKQVGQATAVVLVFVVIAGSYLGLLDALFSRVVNAIL